MVGKVLIDNIHIVIFILVWSKRMLQNFFFFRGEMPCALNNSGQCPGVYVLVPRICEQTRFHGIGPPGCTRN